MRSRYRVVALLLLCVAAAGCADINPPPAGTQNARFGVLITWNTTRPANTPAAEKALVVGCGLPASTEAGPGGVVAGGESSSYVSVPAGVLSDKQASCLTTSAIVTLVDILSRPAPSPA